MSAEGNKTGGGPMSQHQARIDQHWAGQKGFLRGKENVTMDRPSKQGCSERDQKRSGEVGEWSKNAPAEESANQTAPESNEMNGDLDPHTGSPPAGKTRKGRAVAGSRAPMQGASDGGRVKTGSTA